MVGILDSWIRDLPQQFQDKKKIGILIRAFAVQMEEVSEVFRQINENTDIVSASGVNLDHIGDIVSLSRKDASYLLRDATKKITDDIYRAALRYKMLSNNTECTYYEIMDAMSLLWDTDTISYKELSERPATICMILPSVDVDAIDPSVGRILSIKPSGVAMIYFIDYMSSVTISAVESAASPVMEITSGIKVDEDVGDMVRIRNTWEANLGECESADVSVIQRKDLWYLDGTYLLDGTKILDAKVTEEVL